MRIFALDSATPSVGLALLEDERVVGELYLNLGRHHAEVLLPAAEDLLRSVGWSWETIGLLACTVGPGSFTGIRIGLSTVKGLALALQRPVAAVSTLEALAMNRQDSRGWVCPLIDARKTQVYAALYLNGIAGGTLLVGKPKLVSIEALLRELPSEKIHFIGDGAQAHHALIRDALGERALVGESHGHRLLASVVGLIGLRDYRLGNCLDPLSLSPCYLQVSSAEVLGDETAGSDWVTAPPGLAGGGSAVDISAGLR
ncbi:MAG: tRNA (adenosine(37)-N6)-threonylcarbamoyltransferase complex dimerization subunit type 1 TsaB [Syntrophaceae bacterium]|nr:tRNA (adenosine(37)-N6)-threonylcarbamoyltransferase complex dimerization subunit type 1 TsaB [Syntrophaceae bacterium]